jgi:hypothetical protein
VHQLDSGASRERATVYAADGSQSGTVTVLSNFHTAWTDSNQNHQPDPGEIREVVDHVSVTCG